jgi:hypothetical protein
MPLPNGADLFEHLENLVAFHAAPCRCAPLKAAQIAGRASLKAQAKSVNAKVVQEEAANELEVAMNRAQ